LGHDRLAGRPAADDLDLDADAVALADLTCLQEVASRRGLFFEHMGVEWEFRRDLDDRDRTDRGTSLRGERAGDGERAVYLLAGSERDGEVVNPRGGLVVVLPRRGHGRPFRVGDDHDSTLGRGCSSRPQERDPPAQEDLKNAARRRSQISSRSGTIRSTSDNGTTTRPPPPVRRKAIASGRSIPDPNRTSST